MQAVYSIRRIRQVSRNTEGHSVHQTRTALPISNHGFFMGLWLKVCWNYHVDCS